MLVLLITGLITLFYFMAMPMALSDPCGYRNPSCEEAASNSFLVGVWVLVGSFVVAVAVATWRRRSRLLYLALLGYLLAAWLTDWGIDRAVARWPG